jgi:response regulator RpfG family c-di-GMP phosphodiesterase
MNETMVANSNILVVDDELSISEILANFLNKKGYTVFRAKTGEEAIEIIKNTEINLVLSDIKMPGMSGVDLLKWIKEFNKFLPVIITTGYPTLDNAIESLKLGAYDYLTKPFHVEEIIEKISRALQARQLEEDHLLFSKLISLHEVTKILSSTYNLAELNDKFLDYSIRLSHSDGGSIMFFNRSSEIDITNSSPSDLDRKIWSNLTFIAASRWVMAYGEPLVIEAGMKNVPAGIPPLPETVNSFIAFPLKTPNRTIGLLNIVRINNPVSFSNVELEIINVLASQASISIENARLYQNIRDNYLKTISGFALAVEAKDKYTHGHSENVMKYTLILAKHLGLSKTEIEQIKYAGLLHDIGKIGIDEAILNKPGKLTIGEFEEIKKHPVLGCRIISNVPFFKSLVPLILHHHEYYNGEGYPEGLKGKQIPLGARILSVADAFEAMTSNRPYRKAMPYEIAFNILIEQKNIQFDPEIVDAFIEVMKVRKT